MILLCYHLNIALSDILVDHLAMPRNSPSLLSSVVHSESRILDNTLNPQKRPVSGGLRTNTTIPSVNQQSRSHSASILTVSTTPQLSQQLLDSALEHGLTLRRSFSLGKSRLKAEVETQVERL
ncbi:hypothetical protein GMDG_05330 [Pseudogymnoascus destructans 20631-21]|uniref:Uncharacterized protein n=1 Tax=Pseudogymnoascus destructans (strain ATCC MYA-4855 / 20631-21) TaxID=658429 RepID=L8FMT2_PSED2|nr:hypothetical protein GMDG_05330 [Pseudogymnoascus destructans 20631-21]